MGNYIGDVCITTGSYKDKNGVEKKKWLKVGSMYKSEKCEYIKLDVMPLPTQNGLYMTIFRHDNNNKSKYETNNNDNYNDVPAFTADFVPSIDDVCPF